MKDLSIFDYSRVEDHFDLKTLDREDKVAILTIDEKAVKEIGHWPWSREVMGKVIDKLMSYDPKVLAFDIVWPEPDPKSAIPALVSVRDFAKSKGINSPELEKKINSDLARMNSDEIFGRTVLKHSDRLVMGAYYELESTRGFYDDPHQDHCFFNLWEKSYEYSYFEKEEPILLPLDESEAFLPEPWIEVLESHLATVELKTISEQINLEDQYIEEQMSSLKSLLSRYQINLNEQGLIIIVQYLVNGRTEELKPQIERLNPLLASSPGNISRLLKEIDNTVDVNLRGKIKSQISLAKKEYCSRFLTKDDEALERYKARWEDIQSENEEFANLSFADGLKKFKDLNVKNLVPQTFGWSVNIPAVADGTKYSAFFNAHQDSDGSIRRGQLITRSGSMYMPSLPLAAFLRGSNYIANLSIQAGEYDTERFKYPAPLEIINAEDDDPSPIFTVPIDTHGRLPINYAGGDRMFPYLSVAELMSDSTKALVEKRVLKNGKWQIIDVEVDKLAFIKGTHFLMGASATGIYDLRVTPFSENYPGVETHANILNNLLQQDFLTRKASEEEQLMPMVMLILGVLLSLVIAKMGALSGALASIISLVGVLYYDSIFLFGTGTVVTIIFPIVLILVLYIFLTGYKYFTEESQKRELKGTFQKYVSPSIVNEVLKDPTNLQLGGRKQIMSVFFSDVRGFTTISEKLDPNALSDLLNSYLTPMTEIVFKNKGTLDKYMGDAVMAFFGAPIPYKEHALMACRCALEQLEELKRLQAIYEKKGMPAIDIGIGINTGEMSVGNMGSETVRNYTVMGDAVNLGSRLEGINKQYGTRIIISEFTYQEVKDHVVAREIDWVRVKGKALPVKIYELISEKEPQSDVVSMLDSFKQGFEEYHNRAFEKAVNLFTTALNHKPDDPVSKLYIERCQSYLATPPPADWDGVYVMTTK